MKFNIIKARTDREIQLARELFLEYEEYLNVDLCFQDFEKELASLPGEYSPPNGELLVAFSEGHPAGCAAIRKIDEGICEMKRLFVKPQYRGAGLGKLLAESIINEALDKNYSLMRLDTLERLKEAINLYESLGFKQTDAYYNNPLKGVVYWELELKNYKALKKDS